MSDNFGSKKEITDSSGNKLSYYSLEALEKAGLGQMSRLPFTVRVLIESVLRNQDGFAFTEDPLKDLANWQPGGERKEMPYKPARVVLQDFTGVPALVDLAAMRDAMKELGGDPSKINPLVRCDLVIDHSVQVDHFGKKDALGLNEKIEFRRNKERYEFLKWGQQAFKNFKVVPPSTGIVHQVNLEYLSGGVFIDRDKGFVCPDSCVGTDSHTTMVNGLGVLAWGVGGIEAEAVMLDQPIYMLVPDVVGFKLTGKLAEGTTATDLVLRITEMCREIGVVGKFVEFFGEGLETLSVADRATIGNMAPEQGSTVSFFPIDDAAIKYLKLTGRSDEMIDLTERYCKEQGLYRTAGTPDPEFTEVVELDISTVEPAIAGPKRPHDRIPLSKVGPTYQKTLTDPVGPKGIGLEKGQLENSAEVKLNGTSDELRHGAVVIAAITSCTNTSNPSVMIGAGLVAKKALEKGLTVPKFVKTSLAPGSTVVTEYLNKANLTESFDALGFHTVGYGCTTCIGNSGPLHDEVESAIKDSDLVVSAVLSGNRNFEGRVHPLTRTNYLASPPLVVAYALAGSTAVDITKDSLGKGKDGEEVYLKDIWPTAQEVQDLVDSSVNAEMFKLKYGDVFSGSAAWKNIDAASTELYPWDENSTYIQLPPFFSGIRMEEESIEAIKGAKLIGLFGDSVTTDHISPAGAIAKDSPAADYLRDREVTEDDFNSYGSRRGNDRIMKRGTFANVRIRNLLTPEKVGNHTVYHPENKEMTFFEAAEKYEASKIPLMVVAGKEYGSGSSRDWAAKGPYLLGVQAVIAETYERIHRSNLIGMGILPLQFKDGESASTYGLTGNESFDVHIDNDLKPQQPVKVTVTDDSGSQKDLEVMCRIDTPVEIQYYRDGGILRTVLKNLARA